MTDHDLRELGKQLPWDRPDAERRDAARASLLNRPATLKAANSPTL